MTNLLVIHALQAYAPSLLNRGEDGKIKTCRTGGHNRARISSQAIKHAIRTSDLFKERFGLAGDLTTATRLLPRLVGEYLARQGIDDQTVKAVVQRAARIGKKEKKKPDSETNEGDDPPPVAELPDQTGQILRFSGAELASIADQLLTAYRENPEFEPERVLRPIDHTAVDIALFGRMSTSEALDDVRAVVQMAHSFTTNRLYREVDFYTAMDDLTGQGGLLGRDEFTSSVYYKYATVDLEKLSESLGQVGATAAMSAFVSAMCLVHPGGKQNTFAAHNPPDFVLLEKLQNKTPISYANAFLVPVEVEYDPTARGATTMSNSVSALLAYADRVSEVWGHRPERGYLTTLPVECAYHDLGALSAVEGWVAA